MASSNQNRTWYQSPRAHSSGFQAPSVPYSNKRSSPAWSPTTGINLQHPSSSFPIIPNSSYRLNKNPRSFNLKKNHNPRSTLHRVFSSPATTSVSFPKGDKSHIKCFRCSDYGHYANKCPRKTANGQASYPSPATTVAGKWSPINVTVNYTTLPSPTPLHEKSEKAETWDKGKWIMKNNDRDHFIWNMKNIDCMHEENNHKTYAEVLKTPYKYKPPMKNPITYEHGSTSNYQTKPSYDSLNEREKRLRKISNKLHKVDHQIKFKRSKGLAKIQQDLNINSNDKGKRPIVSPLEPFSNNHVDRVIISGDYIVEGTDKGNYNTTWYINSKISRHMTPDPSMFTHLKV